MDWIKIYWCVIDDDVYSLQTRLISFDSCFLPTTRNSHIVTWCSSVECAQVLIKHSSMQKQLTEKTLDEIVNPNGWFPFLVIEDMLSWWLEQGIDTSYFCRCVETNTFEHRNTPVPSKQRIETVFAHRRQTKKLLMQMIVDDTNICKDVAGMILDYL
jgi:hypothetical protein